jgi:hypothetical protein
VRCRPDASAEVEAAVAESPELARPLRIQVETARMIRAAAAHIEAPEALRRRIEQRRSR